MPRNLPRKDQRHHKLSSNDSPTQPLMRWNRNHSHKQQKWWIADDHESLPRLGQYVVSNPTANSVSQTKTGGLTHTSTSYQRDHMLACGGPGSYHQKNQRTRLSQQSPRAVMLSSSEVKEYLLQAVEEGKRKVDEWINSEFEKASAPERDIIIWEACAMDWQPEKTVVIPQTVTIRYPWDATEDIGKGLWRRKRNGRDGIMDGTS